MNRLKDWGIRDINYCTCICMHELDCYCPTLECSWILMHLRVTVLALGYLIYVPAITLASRSQIQQPMPVLP